MAIDPAEPLKPLSRGWLEKIKLAMRRKKKLFGDDAKEIMRFFSGSVEDFWKTGTGKTYASDDRGAAVSMPTFRMVVNKAFEFKALYGPSLYYQNPNRQCTPIELPMLPVEIFGDVVNDPMAQQYAMTASMQNMQEDTARKARATLWQQLLNYLPNEQDAKTHMRRGIDEALLKGMGIWLTELWQPPGYNGSLVGTFWHSIDDFCFDPDARSYLDGVQWMALRCVEPHWEVERKYGYPRDSLKTKANLESLRSQGESSDNWEAEYYRSMGQSNDLIVYWKIWSKMGMGTKLTGMPRELSGVFDEFGDHCYLVVAEGFDEPLNVHKDEVLKTADMLQMAGQMGQQLEVSDTDLFMKAQWPIPFWIDGGWPITALGYHWSPDSPWPISPLRPGLSELHFLNWGWSCLAGKIRITARDFIVMLKSAENNFKAQVKSGDDLTILEIDPETMGTRGMGDVVQFLQHPDIKRDLYTILEAANNQFEKAVGLPEMMYGIADTQSRSATDAAQRSGNAMIRPNDMAVSTDNAMTEIARKEAFAAYWLLSGEDVRPILGTVGASLWEQLVATMDPEAVAREFDFRIEAGSTRRPNKDTRIAQMNEAAQVFAPILSQAAGAGVVGPWNAFVSDWCKAHDLDAKPYLFPPPPPMPPPQAGPPEQNGPPEQPRNGA